MTLSRLQVEAEGFLSELDIAFTPGLNVIIGARGTGKTSIVELIRFVLNAPGFTEDARQRGALQATAILQGGAASLSYTGRLGTNTVITRSAGGYATSTADEQPRCTILAQNEVEAIGAQTSGRLHLLDRFRTVSSAQLEQTQRLQADLESLTRQISDILAEGTSLSQQAQALNQTRDNLASARSDQQRLLAQAQASEEDRRSLAELERASNRLAAREALVTQTLDEIDVVATELTRIKEGSWITLWESASINADPILQDARDKVGIAYDQLDSVLATLVAAADDLQGVKARDLNDRQSVDDRGRVLRHALESVQSGIGFASRRVQELEERLGQLTAISARLSDRRERFLDLSTKRDQRYDDWETLREQAFSQRSAIADRLNATLGPQIRVTMIEASRIDDYQAALIAALRGSGLHYNSLAPQIAKAVSPIELANWVERGSIHELAENVQLSPDRAAALISALRSSGTEGIVTSHIEDEAVFELLDGREYKSTDRLSIGQRCTVVLPILLGQHADTLIVDQPEDHLDNAFIASTLVPALRARQPQDQFIFTSHNANIPVLGEADNVIVMNSDGDRGYVKAYGPLSSPEIVEAINNLMEGGREAFEARARFYGDRSQDN